MTDFMNKWKAAIKEAQDTGVPATIYKQDHMLDKPRPVARTMHPAFIGTKPPKHDPIRDGK